MHKYLFLLEIIGIFIIILFQFGIYYRTRRSIRILKGIYPALKELKLKRLFIPESYASKINGFNLHRLISADKDDDLLVLPEDYGDADNEEEDQDLSIEVLDVRPSFSEIFHKITRATNTYLVRNKGHAADFKIIRDIADREMESQDEQIFTTINLPLYLGLLGTIGGIVIGLGGLSTGITSIQEFLFPTNGTTDELINQLEGRVPNLLVAIAFAMSASFIGLLLTVIAHASQYKSALKECNERRNNYFTFIQTELLPILKKDMTSSLNTLQANMNRFNVIFNDNIDKFSNTISLTKENIELQRDFIKKLQEIGYNEIVTGNIEIFKEVQKSSKHFVTFISYQENLNETLGSAQAICDELNKLASRFRIVEQHSSHVANYLKNTVEDNGQMIRFLKKNFGEIESREKAMRSLIADLDNTFKKSAEHLRKRAEEEFDSLRSFTTDELNHIQKAYETSRPQFSKLAFLEQIDEKIGQLNFGNAQLLTAIRNLNGIGEARALKSTSGNNAEIISSLNRLNDNIEKLQTSNKTLFGSISQVWSRTLNYLRALFTM